MATVQSMMLRFVQANDPYTKAGVEFAAGTVGTTGGDSLTAQRQLDVYNAARFSLFKALKIVHPRKSDLARECGAIITHNTTFTFTLTGTVSVATKPTGYLDFISLLNASNVQIFLLDDTYIPMVLAAIDPYYTQTATNMHIFDIGTQFVHYGTFVTTASTYKLAYLGLSTFVLTDVTNGTSVETFNDQYHNVLLELAAAIASEQGMVEVDALATKLLTAQRAA